MKQILTRTIGIALIAAGVAGLVFSIIGLFVLVQVQHRVESAVMKQLEPVDRALAATADGLAVADDTLTQATDTVDSLERTMSNVGTAIGDTVPTIDSVAGFLGENLPNMLGSTQDTLNSVAKTAQIVDDALGVITSIPLLGLDKYNPDTSFNKGLSDVATSLDEIPDSLDTAHDGLTTASSNLETLGQDFGDMASSISQVTTSVENAQTVLAEYQGVIGDLQDLVTTVRESLPNWLRWLRWGLSLILIWLGIAQIGLITQGWDLMGRSQSEEKEEPKPKRRRRDRSFLDEPQTIE